VLVLVHAVVVSFLVGHSLPPVVGSARITESAEIRFAAARWREGKGGENRRRAPAAGT